MLIQEVLKDSPAYKSGLKPLDIIVKVDDDVVVDLSLSEAIELIRGPKLSSVILTVLRSNKDKTQEILEIEVIRDVITVPSVSGDVLERGGKYYGYLAISII